MKQRFHAKVIGHELFSPDAKNEPMREGIKLKLSINAERPVGKPSKGTLAIEKDQAAQFPIGVFLRITVEDSQQELDLKPESAAPREEPEQNELIRDPSGGRRGRSRAH